MSRLVKRSAPRAVNNVRGGLLGVAAAFVLPATLAILGGVGLAVVPAGGRSSALAELELAEERLRDVEQAKQDLAPFLERGGFELVAQSRARVEAMVPVRVASVDIYSTFRMVCDAEGIELTGLNVGAWSNPSLAVLDDQIAYREVVVDGSCTPTQLSRLLDRLAAVGLPCTVLDFTMTRNEPTETEFYFRCVLGIHQRQPAPEVESEIEDLGDTD